MSKGVMTRKMIGLMLGTYVAATLGDTTAATAKPAYARVDIAKIGADRLQELTATPDLGWWAELDAQMLVLAEASVLDTLGEKFTVERLAVEPRPERLYRMLGARRDDLATMDVDVLAMGGRQAVVQARSDDRPTPPHRHHAAVVRFEPNTVMARQSDNQPLRRLEPQPHLAELIAEVDGQRWLDDVGTLAGYNRWTHGSEILDARDWLVQQFDGLPGLSVTTEVFEVGATDAYNVIATLTGTVRPDDLFIVGAHYDSTSQSASTAAPGAEDNASGCAGVLEMARVFTANPPEATVLFICYAGEEQGLHGSVDHATKLVNAGLNDNVQTVLTMDMIGYTGDADLDCLLETSSQYSALADAYAAAAVATDLRIVISFNPFGSDHVPYLNRNIPALLTIENDWDSYPCYHNTCDTIGNVDLAMGREVLEMNVATLGQMIGVSNGAIFTDGFESGDTTAWSSGR